MSKHVIFIHGIGNKPEPEQLKRIWLRSLSDSGDGLDLILENISFSFVYWADLFYSTPLEPSRYESNSDDIAISEDFLYQSSEADWLDSMQRRFEDVIIEDGSEIQEPSGDMSYERIPLPRPIRNYIMREFLPQVYQYLFNRNDIKTIINNRVLEDIGEHADKEITIVGHSMGSIIAYDVIRNSSNDNLKNLLTIGSPLGIDEVQDELNWSRDNGFPEALSGKWINIYDPKDVVSRLDTKLANDFKRNGREVIIDIKQHHRGLWTHSATKYLSGRVVQRELSSLVL